jgi:ribonuclease D
VTETLRGAPGEDHDEPQAPPPEPLTHPRNGVPAPVVDVRRLRATAAAFAAGTGPVAVDAERASGYRYGQSAYLVQLRRAGAGTALVDPVPLPDLSPLGEVIADVEWVLHAANQDLPCLAEVGLRPTRIFDTELAGRLAGFAKVGLGAMVEQVLGLSLEKGHSAADWSTRPLPEPWLRYAALDVEVLVELRDALEAELEAQGKLAWAHEEFAAIVAAPPPPPRAEPWRRTSGIHRLRGRRQLAAVRELWEARDELARRRDTAPGRVLPDAALINAATAAPTDPAALLSLPVFGGRSTRRHLDRWFGALQRAAALPDDELPAVAGASDGPPPPARWAERDPQAAARLARTRKAVGELAEELSLPVENLLQPDLVRRLTWSPPEEVTPETVAGTLRAGGARRWQVTLTAERLAGALAELPED